MAGVVLQPTPAPGWDVSAWLNGDPGSLGHHRGKVVLIGFFQPECPGSREFAVPLFQRWSALYGDREDVTVVLVHSVFEDSGYRTPERLREFIGANGISFPVGIDAHDGANDSIPVTMHHYHAGGTPHIAIVDKEGMLRFSHFGTFDPEPVEAFIERLQDEAPYALNVTYGSTPGGKRNPRAPESPLSGSYAFKTGSATGICGALIPGQEVDAELTVHRDAIDIEFLQPFLGLDELEVSYDGKTGRIEGESNGATGPRGMTVFRLEGTLNEQARPAELEFELTLLDGKCTIPGRARSAP
jgi:hypothetical protein